NQRCPGPLADAKKADALRVSIGTGFEVVQGRPHVAHFVISHPLERLIAGMPIAFPLSARLEGEDLETVGEESFAVRYGGPPIGAEFQAEQDDAFAPFGRLQIRSLQPQTIHVEYHVFGAGHRLAARDDKDWLFLKDAD